MVASKRFVSEDDVETQVLPWGTFQWLSEPRVTGTKNMIAAVVTLKLGKGHSRHNHPECEEILYVIEGEGDQTIEINGKKEKRKVKKGDLIHVPTGVYHETINVGWQKMVLFAVYQFPGMETDIKNLPECKIKPAKNN